LKYHAEEKMPTKKLINFFAKCAQIERSVTFKAVALFSGAVFFLVVIPAILIYFGEFFDKIFHITAPIIIMDMIVYISIATGLFFIIWTIVVQWHIGKGTPVPIAPPRKLIIEGPYKLCRNPMQFGAMIYYLGIGTYFSSLTTGVFCMLFVLILTLTYNKRIEEKELEIKFGRDYLDYKCKTPFLIPWLW
jgi:protein-S-isoprenylcysteine O-methyltransferase Ste14